MYRQVSLACSLTLARWWLQQHRFGTLYLVDLHPVHGVEDCAVPAEQLAPAGLEERTAGKLHDGQGPKAHCQLMRAHAWCRQVCLNASVCLLHVTCLETVQAIAQCG